MKTVMMIVLVVSANASATNKNYILGIAPSHIASPINDTLNHPEQWSNVSQRADFYKYYGAQLEGVGRNNSFQKASPDALAALNINTGIELSVEFGSFHLDQNGYLHDPVPIAIQQIEPVHAAGGQVTRMHLDGVFRRILRHAHTNYNLTTATAEVVSFLKEIKIVYPDIKFGLITNLPNWDYTQSLPGSVGIFSDQTGLTYLEILNSLWSALDETEIELAFIEVDMPFNYYSRNVTFSGDAGVNNPQILQELQTWCERRNINFNMIINNEGSSATEFHNGVIDYLNELRAKEIYPDSFTIQSWYPQPYQHSPETQVGTFMYTARAAFDEIDRLNTQLFESGFESPAMSLGSFEYAPAGSNWAYDVPGSGISANNSAFTYFTPAAPQGNQVGIVQVRGQLSRQVTLSAGSFKLSLQAIQRQNYAQNPQTIEVLIDDEVVGRFTPSGGNYRVFSTDSFTLEAGTYTVTIRGASNTDSTAFIDNLSIEPTELFESGFESPAMSLGSFEYAPAGSNWAYDVPGSGISANNSAFTYFTPAAPQGNQVGIVQVRGQLSRQVTLSAGSFKLSLQAIQRQNYAQSPQTIEVLIDDEVVGRFTPSGGNYRVFSTDSFTLEAGTYTLTIRGTSSADSTAFIDNLSIEPVF